MTTSLSRGRRASSWTRPLGWAAAVVLVAASGACGSDKAAVTTTSTTAAAPAPARCTSTARLLIRRNSMPSQICLHVGSVLTLTSDGALEAPWEDLISSNGAVLKCTSRRGKGGTVSGTCTAEATGTSQVTTATRAAGASTNGPGDNVWQLTVTVVA